MKCHTLLSAILAPAAARIYTGFNYGAFWSEQSNVKRYTDFHHGFELAKNLTNAPVPFDSARLYTCITAGTQSDPTEAFQAAIDTGTNLLLGMWISPGATGQSNDAQVDNELAALGKGFEQHGQNLADLIIGLSVGNEDVYRFNNAAVGVGSDNLLLTIRRVRESIAASSYAKYMQGKPIGHTDTAMYAVASGSDFIGMTAYPYWNRESIENANLSFMATLKDTQRRAGNMSVWISEMGWPINGKQNGDAVASEENYQRYWSEVGCQVFGKYNTFWFELLQDSQPDQPDWGLLDTKTHQPRIRDLGCRGTSNLTTPQAEVPVISSLATTFVADATPSATISSNLANKTFTSTEPRTTRITRTSTITVTPTSSTSAGEDLFTVYLTTTAYVPPTITPDSASPLDNGTVGIDNNGKISVCIVMMDLLSSGVFIPVAVAASRVEACEPPPRFTGSPFTMIVSAPAASGEVVSLDLYAPSTVQLSASTAVSISLNGPTCVTSAGVVYEAVVSDGKTYLENPTPSCTAEPSVSTWSAGLSMAPSPSSVRVASSTSPSFFLTPPSLVLVSAPSTFLTVTTPLPPPPSTSPSAVSLPTLPVSSSSLLSSFHSPSAILLSISQLLTPTPPPPASITAPSVTTPAPPHNPSVDSVLAILNDVLSELQHTTWASPISANSTTALLLQALSSHPPTPVPSDSASSRAHRRAE